MPATSAHSGVGILAITPLSGKRSVYNLHVPDGPHNYVIAGGVVVHNCYDELAYVCRSRPYLLTKEDRWQDENREEIRRAQRQNVDPYATA